MSLNAGVERRFKPCAAQRIYVLAIRVAGVWKVLLPVASAAEQVTPNISIWPTLDDFVSFYMLFIVFFAHSAISSAASQILTQQENRGEILKIPAGA
jgi:hypothetical protein